MLDRIPGERQEDGVVNASVTFEHSFNENTKILNSLLVEAGESNTSTRNDLALQVKMTEVLAVSLGFSVQEQQRATAGLEKHRYADDSESRVRQVAVAQPRLRMRALSRCQSRSFSVARLSCCFLPLARPISSFARPFFQCRSSGTSV